MEISNYGRLQNVSGCFTQDDWTSWTWQQQHALSSSNVSAYFENSSEFVRAQLSKTEKELRFQITPYVLSQINPTSTQEQLVCNPWFVQFFPINDISQDKGENWEHKEDFPTRLLQHKYTNRCILRFSRCLAYCTFCFEADRTLDLNSSKNSGMSDWDASLDYISRTPALEEVILSGGEPMLLSDNNLQRIISDLREKTNIRFIRLHTRMLTHNPYRVTSKFTELLRNYKVNEIAFHVAHADEITTDFRNAIYKIKDEAGRNTPLLVSHTPLLAGVNDSTKKLWDLFSGLYELQIKPYYLIHTMPHIPFSNQQRLSVRDGLKLYLPLANRHKSHIAIPEYVIAHHDGKRTVPLELGGTPEFEYTVDCAKKPVVKFKNWLGNTVIYPDTQSRL